MPARREFILLVLLAAACRQGMPVVDPSGARPPTVDGTISGRVLSASGSPLPSRKIDLVEVRSGAKYSSSSDAYGAFTIKVAPGKYRLTVELRPGEQLERPTGEIDINRSDLDSSIEVVIR